MSFGWSAGDIATAILVTYNLIQALDSADGAASEYREAVAFLRDLKRTLEPLQAFTAWDAYPTYEKDVGEQVAYVKGPIEEFLATVVKYEPSLGAKAKDGHHRHVLPKWRWYFFMSKKLQSLRRTIESRMRVIDTLMQRLLVDTQRQLPATLRATYQEFHNKSHDALDTMLSEHYAGISSGIEEIQHQIVQRHGSCLSSGESSLPKSEQKCGLQISSPEMEPESSEIPQKSLREVYYVVLLYLGYFLQNMFLALSRLFQPTRTLMPTLSAKDNTSFLNAIGRQPRVFNEESCPEPSCSGSWPKSEVQSWTTWIADIYSHNDFTSGPSTAPVSIHSSELSRYSPGRVTEMEIELAENDISAFNRLARPSRSLDLKSSRKTNGQPPKQVHDYLWTWTCHYCLRQGGMTTDVPQCPDVFCQHTRCSACPLEEVRTPIR